LNLSLASADQRPNSRVAVLYYLSARKRAALDPHLLIGEAGRTRQFRVYLDQENLGSIRKIWARSEKFGLDQKNLGSTRKIWGNRSRTGTERVSRAQRRKDAKERKS